MLSIIYPYRNRNVKHVQKALDSLKRQSVMDFKVYFVDYGSETDIATKVRALADTYSFVNYQYHPTHFQPWNKCKALNSVIKTLHDGYGFVADVDMIFHNEFVERALELQSPEKAVYFQVGFLDENETKKDKDFNDYEIDFLSTHEATGLTMFPIKALQGLHGFDEFYHFWGAEDTDLHIRLRNHGVEVNFYDEEVLMLHQWHPSYRSKESKSLTKEVQLSRVVQLNHQHLKLAKANHKTVVNRNGWGNILSADALRELQDLEAEAHEISIQKEVFDHFLFSELPNLEVPASYIFSEKSTENTLKRLAKKQLGKKVPSFYSMKEINDSLLLHIISFYRNYPYIYRVEGPNNSIRFTILK